MMETITPFAQVDYRDDHRVFGIKKNDRRYHFLTIGRTGTGKSTLLATLIKGDLEYEAGVAVIDPHGDLADTAARVVPRRRTDVIVGDRRLDLLRRCDGASRK